MQYSISCPGLQSLLDRYSKLGEVVTLCLTVGMEKSLQYLKQQVLMTAPEASGNLKHNTVISTPIISPDLVHGEININPVGESGVMYGALMETGHGPQTMPPPGPISEWMDMKGIDQALLYPIRRKIKNIGYSGSDEAEGKWFVKNIVEDGSVQAEVNSFFSYEFRRFGQ